uniref:Uncharacterized protein n=1 Tax=Opuntia streptacantha TaxID=393608 RepID=A0A7C9FAP1_OPUST
MVGNHIRFKTLLVHLMKHRIRFFHSLILTQELYNSIVRDHIRFTSAFHHFPQQTNRKIHTLFETHSMYDCIISHHIQYHSLSPHLLIQFHSFPWFTTLTLYIHTYRIRHQIFLNPFPIHLFPKLPTFTPPSHLRIPTKHHIINLSLTHKLNRRSLINPQTFSFNHMFILTECIN